LLNTFLASLYSVVAFSVPEQGNMRIQYWVDKGDARIDYLFDKCDKRIDNLLPRNDARLEFLEKHAEDNYAIRDVWLDHVFSERQAKRET
jgi:hypothetical protein